MAKEQGLIHIYYGDGKGKTTAAFGLAFRCAGYGKQVVISQFLKGGASGEVDATEGFPEISVFRGKPIGKFTFQMNEEEKAITAQACLDIFRQATATAVEQKARILVMDEVIDATYGFLPMDVLVQFLDEKPESLEVVITGHSLPAELEERAHYITNMSKKKHPYDQGIMARRDIEF